MKVDVTTSIAIERPLAEVAGYAGDPSNAPDWYERIDTADWETDPPMKLGSRIRFVARFMGRTLEYTYEIVELSPQEQIAMRTADGPFPMNTVYTWRPVGDRVTHMTLRNHGEPTGFTRFASPIVARAMRKAMKRDLANLKQLLER
jgi:uncharacterized membrane protein